MHKLKCPNCGSEELDDDMITVYGMWGELVGTENVKKCKKCNLIIRDENQEGDSTES